ncbi:DUF1841 family protein [candidate division KSB1 bacterium]|nr:DUF1841 family protein [candidate division KSB1 bacterium]
MNFLRNNRQIFFKIWQKLKSSEPLHGEEEVIGKIMQEHPEFHNTWEFADLLDDVEYDVKTEVNPYLHVFIHSVVENQISMKKPIETLQTLKLLQELGLSRHDAIHEIGTALSYELFELLKHQKPFNNESYIQRLKKLVKNVRKNNHA